MSCSASSRGACSPSMASTSMRGARARPVRQSRARRRPPNPMPSPTSPMSPTPATAAAATEALALRSASARRVNLSQTAASNRVSLPRASSYNDSMKPGLAAVLAVALALPGGLGSQLGCSHPTPREPVDPVVEPDEHPPLPPASGTPIGFLVDDAGELKLSDDQLSKLRAINDELATQLAIDEGDMKPEPVEAKKDDNKGRGLGFRAGGSQEGFGGYTGGFPNAPRTAGQQGTDDQGGQRQYVI